MFFTTQQEAEDWFLEIKEDKIEYSKYLYVRNIIDKIKYGQTIDISKIYGDNKESFLTCLSCIMISFKELPLRLSKDYKKLTLENEFSLF